MRHSKNDRDDPGRTGTYRDTAWDPGNADHWAALRLLSDCPDPLPADGSRHRTHTMHLFEAAPGVKIERSLSLVAEPEKGRAGQGPPSTGPSVSCGSDL